MDMIDVMAIDRRDTNENTETADKPSSLTSLEVSIYPSPATEALYVTINKRVVGYQIKDIYSNLLAEGDGLDDGSINVGSLDSGIYYLILQTQGELIVKSFIKN